VSIDLADLLHRGFVGRPCVVSRREHDWSFNCGDACGIVGHVPWRLVEAGYIALTNADDGQKFGLPEPVDAETRANALLNRATIDRVQADPVTADLSLWFSNGLRLDLFNHSTGYEGWEAWLQDDDRSVSVIAMGGGGFSIIG